MFAQAMYNPALFSIRQELEMPAKKTASKNRKQVATSRKKVARKRNVSRKKVAARKKRPVARKKIAKKKVSKKKVSARKNKVSKKRPVTRKKIAKKKVSKKRPVTRKKIAKKKVSKKRPVTRKKIAKKKVSKKKAVSRRGPPARKTSVQRTRSRGDLLSGPIHGISPYKPRRGEEYMSTGQQQYFSEILGAWKGELMFEVDRTVHHMQDEAANFPDPNDRATQESEFGLELRTRDRERKLLRKIDSALSRIDEGSYGFCDETGEEIGLKRLEARPVATLCLEAQERRELAERQFRDRDDRYR